MHHSSCSVKPPEKPHTSHTEKPGHTSHTEKPGHTSAAYEKPGHTSAVYKKPEHTSAAYEKPGHTSAACEKPRTIAEQPSYSTKSIKVSGMVYAIHGLT